MKNITATIPNYSFLKLHMESIINRSFMCCFRKSFVCLTGLNEMTFERTFIFFFKEKYKRDQEKLQEEWLKAQQAISTSTVPKQVTKVFCFVLIMSLRLINQLESI